MKLWGLNIEETSNNSYVNFYSNIYVNLSIKYPSVCAIGRWTQITASIIMTFMDVLTLNSNVCKGISRYYTYNNVKLNRYSDVFSLFIYFSIFESTWINGTCTTKQTVSAYCTRSRSAPCRQESDFFAICYQLKYNCLYPSTCIKYLHIKHSICIIKTI